ncbi:MAG: WxcM-like domain-containing protein [Aestuariibacter sp.]
MIEGVNLKPLKIHTDERGAVMHFINKDSPEFKGFGEVYFSSVNYGVVKGWKCHTEMHMNLVVISGQVKFVLAEEVTGASKMAFCEISLSKENYQLLSIPPKIWLSFRGECPDQTNIIANFADIKHEPSESLTIPVGSPDIAYEWSTM